MDGHGFDHLARRLGQAVGRRGALRLLAGALAAGLAAGDADDAGAACQKPGKPCKRGRQCCSGVCTGKKGKRRCRPAPNQSICAVADNVCRVGAPAKDCGVGVESCFCSVTTRGAAFCRATTANEGEPCSSDDECVARIGAGAACLTGKPDCAFESSCALPCPDPV
jgi:hypothetical protein